MGTSQSLFALHHHNQRNVSGQCSVCGSVVVQQIDRPAPLPTTPGTRLEKQQHRRDSIASNAVDNHYHTTLCAIWLKSQLKQSTTSRHRHQQPITGSLACLTSSPAADQHSTLNQLIKRSDFTRDERSALRRGFFSTLDLTAGGQSSNNTLDCCNPLGAGGQQRRLAECQIQGCLFVEHGNLVFQASNSVSKWKQSSLVAFSKRQVKLPELLTNPTTTIGRFNPGLALTPELELDEPVENSSSSCDDSSDLCKENEKEEMIVKQGNDAYLADASLTNDGPDLQHLPVKKSSKISSWFPINRRRNRSRGRIVRRDSRRGSMKGSKKAVIKKEIHQKALSYRSSPATTTVIAKPVQPAPRRSLPPPPLRLTWPLSTVRGYCFGTGSLFKLDAGRRAPRGEGSYLFRIGQVQKFKAYFERFMHRRRSLSPAPPSPVECRNWDPPPPTSSMRPHQRPLSTVDFRFVNQPLAPIIAPSDFLHPPHPVPPPPPISSSPSLVINTLTIGCNQPSVDPTIIATSFGDYEKPTIGSPMMMSRYLLKPTTDKCIQVRSSTLSRRRQASKSLLPPRLLRKSCPQLSTVGQHTRGQSHQLVLEEDLSTLPDPPLPLPAATANLCLVNVLHHDVKANPAGQYYDNVSQRNWPDKHSSDHCSLSHFSSPSSRSSRAGDSTNVQSAGVGHNSSRSLSRILLSSSHANSLHSSLLLPRSKCTRRSTRGVLHQRTPICCSFHRHHQGQESLAVRSANAPVSVITCYHGRHASLPCSDTSFSSKTMSATRPINAITRSLHVGSTLSTSSTRSPALGSNTMSISQRDTRSLSLQRHHQFSSPPPYPNDADVERIRGLYCNLSLAPSSTNSPTSTTTTDALQSDSMSCSTHVRQPELNLPNGNRDSFRYLNQIQQPSHNQRRASASLVLPSTSPSLLRRSCIVAATSNNNMADDRYHHHQHQRSHSDRLYYASLDFGPHQHDSGGDAEADQQYDSQPTGSMTSSVVRLGLPSTNTVMDSRENGYGTIVTGDRQMEDPPQPPTSSITVPNPGGFPTEAPVVTELPPPLPVTTATVTDPEQLPANYVAICQLQTMAMRAVLNASG